MRRLALLASLAACSGGAPTETWTPAVAPGADPAVFVRNATARPLVYVAVGEGSLALIDVRPTLGPGEYEDRLVEPGSTARATATAAELARNEGVVTVTHDRF